MGNATKHFGNAKGVGGEKRLAHAASMKFFALKKSVPCDRQAETQKITERT